MFCPLVNLFHTLGQGAMLYIMPQGSFFSKVRSIVFEKIVAILPLHAFDTKGISDNLPAYWVENYHI
jgi:hypothetical protein